VSASLLPKRDGPYVILRKMNPLNYELGDVVSKAPITFAHTVQMKLYTARDKSAVLAGEDPANPSPPPPRKSRTGLGKSRGRPKGKPKVTPAKDSTVPSTDPLPASTSVASSSRSTTTRVTRSQSK
jgi:hypothetical protein